MIAGDPFRLLLGVPESAGSRALLGVGTDASAAEIEAALRQRVARTYAHRQGREPEAEHVRDRLRESAAGLLAELKRAGRPATPGKPMRRPPRAADIAPLTDFDQHVLAVLIGSGKWNAQTRSRLVGLAETYGVTVQGLLKVMTGLSEYAKRGGPRLEVSHITAGRRVTPAPVPAHSIEDDADLLARLAPELHEAGPGSTLKLSLLFALLTLLFVVIMAQVLFAPNPAPPVVPEPRGTRTPASVSLPPAAPPSAEPEPVLQPARYPQPPTFRGQALTADAAAAADRCPILVEQIDALARRLTVSDEPSEAVFRGWDNDLDNVSTGWVLVDDRTLGEVRRAIFEALYAASGTPSVTDRLLAALVPPSGRLDEPVDVWRGAWMVGTLAEIAAASSLPPVVVQRAQIHLDLALGGADRDRARGFRSAADAWLERTAVTLADVTEFSPEVYDLWEFWIAAERRLGRGARLDSAVMSAVEALLETSTDLSRQGPSVNVLGRLLSLADFESSRVVRERVLGLFAEQERFESRDLWALTSILALHGPAAWFSEDLVLPESADWIHRRRVADRIAARWPAEASAEPSAVAEVRGLPVDPGLAARWLAVAERFEAEPVGGSPEERIEQIIAAAWVNEAALRLAVGDSDEARRRLEHLEAAGPVDPTGTWSGGDIGAPARRGGAAGVDGQWAVAWEQAGHNIDERMTLLRTLRDSSGSDLGPTDAEAFVRIVYRGTHADLRSMARDLAADQFAYGANVVLELLDQLPLAPANRGTSETISRVTGRILPSSRAQSWPVDARLALLRHALQLLGGPGLPLDARVRSLADAYDSRRACLTVGGSPAPSSAGAHEAARNLADAWRERAAPDPPRALEEVQSLGELERRFATRRRLAEGPIQRFVAAQLAVLELMARDAVIQRPGLAEQVRALLADSGRRRAEMPRALAQAIEAERAMVRLWRLQVAVGREDES